APQPAAPKPASTPPLDDLNMMAAEAHKRAKRGDFYGGVALIDQILARDPESLAAQGFLRLYAAQSTRIYQERLGTLSRAPKVKLNARALQRRSMNHRAGFLLSQVDGRTSFEDLIIISGMNELEASRILAGLFREGIIGH
ncbi:hypothetical protein KKB55_02055, partial [Myxococcota bacterium]|nr:hypothetical protein [Myxococcota bacterium]